MVSFPSQAQDLDDSNTQNVTKALENVTLTPGTKKLAEDADFDLDSKPFKLLMAAKEKWPAEVQPQMRSPGGAQQMKLSFSILNEVGLCPDAVTQPTKVLAYSQQTVC